MQFVGQHFGGHGFAGTAFAGEQGAETHAAGTLAGKTPFVADLEPVAHMAGDLAQDYFLMFRQDQIFPAGGRLNTLRQVIQLPSPQSAAGPPQQFVRIITCADSATDFGTGAQDRLSAQSVLRRDSVQ